MFRATVPRIARPALSPAVMAKGVVLHASSISCLSTRNALRCTYAEPRRALATATARKATHQEVPLVRPDIAHVNINANTPSIFSFFETATSTWQYVIVDPTTAEAAIIDPVLDYDPASGTVSTKSADNILAYVAQNYLNVTHILETHAHADHLTSANYLKSKLGPHVRVGIGGRISQVQSIFASRYGFDDPALISNVFDIYFQDEEEFVLGNYTCRVIHLPGHTPDHVGYIFGSAVFTGDSIFNPDVGSARVDFPGGNAKDLFTSIQRLLSLPQDTLLFVGHDYPPGSARPPMTSVTIKDHQDAWLEKDERTFVQWRQSRDAKLGAPRLLHPSLQVNIRGGRLPPKDSQGRSWFKTPIRGADW